MDNVITIEGSKGRMTVDLQKMLMDFESPVVSCWGDCNDIWKRIQSKISWRFVWLSDWWVYAQSCNRKLDVGGESKMLYQDKYGNIMHPEQVEELSPHEIEERGFHVYEGPIYAVV